MQGDKWRETNEEGRLGAAAISVISMQGDKWRRETRSGSDFGNQQPNLWEVRTPIASSYLGKKPLHGPSGELSSPTNSYLFFWPLSNPVHLSHALLQHPHRLRLGMPQLRHRRRVGGPRHRDAPGGGGQRGGAAWRVAGDFSMPSEKGTCLKAELVGFMFYVEYKIFL